MKELLGQIVRYAVKPFPWKMRKQAAREIAGEEAARPGGLLRAAKVRCGLGGMLLAGTALFGWCLLAACALDFLLPLPETLREAAGALCCCIAFGCCTGSPEELFLKLCFVLLTAVYRGKWSVAAAFLIAYENTAALLPRSKGASET